MSTLANDSSTNGAGGGQGGTNASSSSGIDNTDHATGTNGNDTSSGSGTLGEIPWAFIDCSTDTLMLLISHMLNLLIQHNDQVVLTPDALTRFHSRAAPGISVLEYLRRIVKYTNMEVSAGFGAQVLVVGRRKHEVAGLRSVEPDPRKRDGLQACQGHCS